MPDVYELERTSPTAAIAQKLAGPAATGVQYMAPICLQLEMSGGAENAFPLALENPFGVDVMIVRTIHHLKTKGATASAVLDVGVDVSATDTDDTILDGVTIGSGGTNGTITDSQDVAGSGTNATEKARIWNKAGGTNPFLTAKILAAEAAAYVGTLYVFIIPMG